MQEKGLNVQSEVSGGVKLSGEDLARIIKSLKDENDRLKSDLSNVTGILSKLGVLNRVISAPADVFPSDYVKSCVDKMIKLTDEFVGA